MDTNKILNAVEKLHANAVQEGTLKIDKIVYTFKFNGRNYEVTSSDGKIKEEFNTREIKVAKKWLREYLLN